MTAATSKVLKTALVAIGETAFVLIITYAIEGLAKLADKLIVTKEELREVRDEAASTAESLANNAQALAEEQKSIDDLVSQYKTIVKTSSDISQSKDELLKIQNDLNDKYGDEASKLDLVNGKYEDQIALLEELSAAELEKWKRENASKIAEADRIKSLKVGWKQLEGGQYVEPNGDYTDTFYKGSVDRDDKLVASLFKIKGVSQDIADIYGKIEGMDFLDDVFSNSVLLTGDIYQAQEQLGQLIDEYSKLKDYDADTLKLLEDHFNVISAVIQDIDTYSKSLNQIDNSGKGEIFTIDPENIRTLEQLNAALDGARDKWFDDMSDMSKEVTTTVDTITKALQTLATGDALSHDDFWGLKKIDTDNVLTSITQVGDSFVLNQEQLIALKDQYVQQQIDAIKAENETLKIKRDELQATIDQSEIEMSMLGARGLINAESRKAMADARQSVAQGKKNLELYGEQIRNNNILINEWNGKLGDTVDKTKLIADLQAKADAAEKAMNSAIDAKIKSLNNEKAILESQKDVLEEQLKVLEEQQKEIEDIIKDYETVGNLVKDETERQIKALEEQKKAEEDAAQAKIDALKKTKEAQEKENSLIEKELDLKEKLANLEKAKSTKVRTYSAARGFHFDVDKEAVLNAEEEVSKAQKAYDEAAAEDLYNKQLESLEKEKDMITANFDEQIKAVEEYANLWTDAINEQKIAEDELLAEQILGADWREKIKAKDIKTLNKYKANLKAYNTQLTSLVNNEIKSLNDSIKAKNDEIDAKGKQIQKWNDYKNTVAGAIDTVKNKYNEYETALNNVITSESLNYENREKALRDFMNVYEGLIDEIAIAQGKVQDVHAGLYIDTNVPQISREVASFIEAYYGAIVHMQDMLNNSSTDFGVVNSAWDAKLVQYGDVLRKIASGTYASGGVIDYTGVANVHGSKTSAETVFNAAQSKELYNMVKSGDFSAKVADRAMAGVASVLRNLAKGGGTDNSNTVINLHQEFHGLQNGREFAQQFNANIEQYWRTKLTESLVKY